MKRFTTIFVIVTFSLSLYYLITWIYSCEVLFKDKPMGGPLEAYFLATFFRIGLSQGFIVSILSVLQLTSLILCGVRMHNKGIVWINTLCIILLVALFEMIAGIYM